MLRETVIEFKLSPMGDKPRNKPISPVKPKLNATDKTSCSTMSMLFLPKKRMLTKQYPGKNVMKTKLKMYRGTKVTEKSGLLGMR